MEAQQCVKLSLTNRPFGLISSSRAQRTTAGAPNKIKRQANKDTINTHIARAHFRLLTKQR